MLLFLNLQKSAALYASRHNEAVLALDRALGHLNKDEGNLGLLWLGRAFQLAPADAEDLQFVMSRQSERVAGEGCDAKGNRVSC